MVMEAQKESEMLCQVNAKCEGEKVQWYSLRDKI